MIVCIAEKPSVAAEIAKIVGITSPAVAERIRKMEEEDLEQAIAIDQLSFSKPWPKHSFQFEIKNNLKDLINRPKLYRYHERFTSS